MFRQPFFAVRVTIYHSDGSMSTRDYVRTQHMGQEAFTAFAVGDMIRLVTKPDRADAPTEMFSWWVEEVDFETVRQNRLYNHTTHREG